MTAIKLFTWDYVYLRSYFEPHKTKDLLTERDRERNLGKQPKPFDHQHLVNLGLLARTIDVVKGKYSYDPWDEITTIQTTDAGKAWVKKIETRWEDQVAGLAFWEVTTSNGGLVIGIPADLHPDDVEPDLRKLFGLNFHYLAPRHDDEARGSPHKLKTDWRPWNDASRAWVDCRNEGRPWWRGAYMRPHGAPFDPTLSFIECVGQNPGHGVLDEHAERLAVLDTINVEDAA